MLTKSYLQITCTNYYTFNFYFNSSTWGFGLLGFWGFGVRTDDVTQIKDQQPEVVKTVEAKSESSQIPGIDMTKLADTVMSNPEKESDAVSK